MRSAIWMHIAADVFRNVVRFAPFVMLSWVRGIETKESCGSRYGNVSWRDAPPSMEQLRIERYLASAPVAGKAILHVGIGSSSVAKQFHGACQRIDGLTVMPDEVEYAESLGYANYQAYLVDKFSPALTSTLPARYHYIVDNNLSSFAPSRSAFESMIRNYVQLLEPGGMILTDRVGMHYHEAGAFSIADEDLQAFERTLPVRFEQFTSSVRGLVKIEGHRPE